NRGRERHFPVDPEEHANKDDETETLLKEIGEVFGERDASALDVVDGRGKKAADRMVLKEGNRLANDFCIDLIAQIRDRGLADVLNLCQAKIFGNGFCEVDRD